MQNPTDSEYLVKIEPKPESRWGCDPYHRTLEQLLESGIIILDKEAGMTSHAAAAQVKNLFLGTKVIKVGHGGTLDPAVTGILPLTLNQANIAQEIIL